MVKPQAFTAFSHWPWRKRFSDLEHTSKVSHYEWENLISKLTNVVYRQEIDTYDPNLEAPRDNIGYFKKVDTFFDKNGTFKC